MSWWAGNRCRNSRCEYTVVAQHCLLLNKCLFYCLWRETHALNENPLKSFRSRRAESQTAVMFCESTAPQKRSTNTAHLTKLLTRSLTHSLIIIRCIFISELLTTQSVRGAINCQVMVSLINKAWQGRGRMQ